MSDVSKPNALECKYITRLSRQDYNLLNLLAELHGYTPQQFGRYAIRVYLQQKLSEGAHLSIQPEG
jgi:hypothetical protein